MSTRQIFPDLKLFKKEVNERFLLVTQEIYRQHPVYTYRDDEAETGVLIYPSYADIDHDGLQPRIISKIGSYNYHLMDTLNNNMSKEVVRNGVLVGYENAQIITVSITVLVRAHTEEESSDIADELSSLVVNACRKMYSGAGLVVRGMQVSETDIFDPQQDIFQTSAAISFDVPWTSTHVETSAPIKDVITEIGEDPLYFNTYRSPGVNVAVVKEKKNTN